AARQARETAGTPAAAGSPSADPDPAPGAPVAGPASSGPVTGWRGDGSGRWPDATPPLEWGRYLKVIADHRCQSAKPKGPQPETDAPLTHGLIREWLVAGPFDAPEISDKEKELDGAQLPETELQPDAGEKAGAAEWKPWTGTGVNMATLNNYGHVGVNFTRLYGQVEHKAAYAHTYLYSPEGGAFRFVFATWQSTRVWLNGELVCPRLVTREHIPQNLDVTLKPGWNRLLLKSVWNSGKADSEWSAWKFAVYLQPLQKNPEVVAKNLRWHVPTPGSSIAAPAVVGDRLYVTADPYFVACYSAEDGTCLWVRSMSYFDMLEPEKRKELPDFEAKAKPVTEQLAAACEAFTRGDASKLGPAQQAAAAALKELDPARATRLNAWEQNQPGWTVTPCSDGKKVWVWCQTGAAACYDLDGKLLWSRQEEFPGNRHHGFSISPVLTAGKFVVMQNHATAYDAETGKTAWTAKGMTLTWGSLLPLTVNGQACVFSADGTLIDAADGKILWGPAKLGSSIVPTPVTDGAGTLFAYSSGKGLGAYALPGMNKLWDDTAEKIYLGAGWAGACSGSPLYHDGLIYQVSMTGVLICRDAKTGALVYKQDLDCAPRMGYVTTPGMSASLSLAGKYIYATDNTFVTVVFEPGRTFKQVAKNVIAMDGEGQTWTYPVFKGSRIYYRAPTFLYCIGEK
ncbi:MAG: PQQ-binding-like beta-propeller repeat protein, partial [Planctomycetota bacterium]|nr:PQQ-binding-like beta-propeller repeat protein [Planctomycetota bacterium]